MGTMHIVHNDIAVKIGLNAALILEGIGYWVKHNEENAKHIYDGHVWTYNSTDAFCKQFPFLGERTITRTLKKLETEGYILVGNYNKLKYDRTKWYALTEKAIQLLGVAISDQVASGQNDQMEVDNLTDSIQTKRPNQSGQNDLIETDKKTEPIPKNTQCIKHNIPPTPQRGKAEDAFKAYTDNPNLLKALKDYESMRKAMKKPLQPSTKERMLKKLDSMADSDEGKIAILNQSVDHNWQGIFPLKEQAEPERPVFSLDGFLPDDEEDED